MHAFVGMETSSAPSQTSFTGRSLNFGIPSSGTIQLTNESVQNYKYKDVEAMIEVIDAHTMHNEQNLSI